MLPSGMFRRVDLVRTDVREERFASAFRVGKKSVTEEISQLLSIFLARGFYLP
jgi:hypothetical protein